MAANKEVKKRPLPCSLVTLLSPPSTSSYYPNSPGSVVVVEFPVLPYVSCKPLPSLPLSAFSPLLSIESTAIRV